MTSHLSVCVQALLSGCTECADGTMSVGRVFFGVSSLSATCDDTAPPQSSLSSGYYTCAALSEEHSLDSHRHAWPFSPKQLALAWGVCVMTRTHLYEHRKCGFIIFRHAIKRKWNPGGFIVESNDQPANIWTCLCFYVLAHRWSQQLMNTASFQSIKAK